MGNVDLLESNLYRNLQSDRKFPICVNAVFFLLLFVEQVPRSLTEDLDRSKWSLDRDKQHCKLSSGHHESSSRDRWSPTLPIQRRLIVPNVSNLEFSLENKFYISEKVTLSFDVTEHIENYINVHKRDN